MAKPSKAITVLIIQPLSAISTSALKMAQSRTKHATPAVLCAVFLIPRVVVILSKHSLALITEAKTSAPRLMAVVKPCCIKKVKRLSNPTTTMVNVQAAVSTLRTSVLSALMASSYQVMATIVWSNHQQNV